MPYEIKGKCVYKKDGGAKVGCTKGDVNKYLAALHANADESTDKSSSKPIVKELLHNSLKQLMESTTETEAAFVSEWPNLTNYDDKRKTFAWDTKEYLTGFFGVVGVEGSQTLLAYLYKIFDFAMGRKYDMGISYTTSTGQMKPQIYSMAKILDTNDVDMVYDIINGTFNQD